MSRIKFVIVDDHLLFREGLKELLSTESDLECVAAVDGSEEVVNTLKQRGADVVLLDISMPGIDGIELAKAIKSQCPETAVLIITAYAYSGYIQACIQAGVDGYLLKNTPRRQLVEAIRMVRKGESVFCAKVTDTIRHRMRGATAYAGPCKDLKAREIEVIKLVAKGITNKQIASMLNISVNTVGTHLSNIFRKIGAESRTEAAIIALKEGLIRTAE